MCYKPRSGLYVSSLANMSPNTIRKGIQEVQSGKLEHSEKLRKPGGGRKKLSEKSPRIGQILEKIMYDVTAGDPMSILKWTHKSTYAIAEALKKKGVPISEDTVGRMLKSKKYSLQANKKRYEGTSHPDRDAQFNYINNRAKKYLKKKQPIISVDTKKKELVGNFKNPGKTWRKKGTPEEVNAYDFPNLAELTIEVLHFPPATSKWNKIEHRMFSFISQNWKGKPLI